MSRSRVRSLLPVAGVALAATLLVGCSGTRSVGSQIDDAAITTKIEAKLAADPETNNFEIDVDTVDGVVRLSGTVETQAAGNEALHLAGDTRGVRDVINDLEIGDPDSPGDNISDAWIVTKIKAKLTADPEINPFNIDVDAVQGVVTLSGVVAKDEARREAVRLAETTRGVKEVHDRVEVR